MSPCACLLIADDLTGACDAAVHFALRGYQTSVMLNGQVPDTTVVAINTDSRHATEPEINARMSEAAAICHAPTIFKKIDSTLRGNTRAEIRAAMEAFACTAAVVTPAFPALGRIVRDGWLSLPDDLAFAPIHVAGHLDLAEPVTICDAACEQDLDRLVAEFSSPGERVLWAGSGGLAAALARSWPPGDEVTLNPVVASPTAVLYCIGSNHKVTNAQTAHLKAESRAVECEAAKASPERVAEVLHEGTPVILRIPLTGLPAERLRELVLAVPAVPLFLCGGDTAALVCRAIGGEKIELIDEIVPGLPRGVLHFEEGRVRQVLTKSGGFGQPDALSAVAHFYLCPRS